MLYAVKQSACVLQYMFTPMGRLYSEVLQTKKKEDSNLFIIIVKQLTL